MKETDIKYENGNYWVLGTKEAYTVMVAGITHSKSDSAYPPTPDGLTLAVSRCNYLARRYRVIVVNEKTGEVTRMTDDTLTHTEACIIIKKLNATHKGRRIQVQEISDTRMVLE